MLHTLKASAILAGMLAICAPVMAQQPQQTQSNIPSCAARLQMCRAACDEETPAKAAYCKVGCDQDKHECDFFTPSTPFATTGGNKY